MSAHLSPAWHWLGHELPVCPEGKDRVARLDELLTSRYGVRLPAAMADWLSRKGADETLYRCSNADPVVAFDQLIHRVEDRRTDGDAAYLAFQVETQCVLAWCVPLVDCSDRVPPLARRCHDRLAACPSAVQLLRQAFPMKFDEPEWDTLRSLNADDPPIFTREPACGRAEQWSCSSLSLGHYIAGHSFEWDFPDTFYMAVDDVDDLAHHVFGRLVHTLPRALPMTWWRPQCWCRYFGDAELRVIVDSAYFLRAWSTDRNRLQEFLEGVGLGSWPIEKL